MKKLLLFMLLVFGSISLRAQPNSKWTYDTKVDEMTAAKAYYAATETSNDQVKCFLTVRHKNKANEVTLSIRSAIFNIENDGLKLKVKFDDGPIQTYWGLIPNDNSYNFLFIQSPSKFIKQLKTSKKVLIRFELYNKGINTVAFNTEGLNWDH